MAKEVTESFFRMTEAASAAGLDIRGWTLNPGSASNGISWSLTTGRDGADSIVGLPFDHIGKTRVEAIRTLDGMAAAFESVAYAKRRQS